MFLQVILASPFNFFLKILKTQRLKDMDEEESGFVSVCGIEMSVC